LSTDTRGAILQLSENIIVQPNTQIDVDFSDNIDIIFNNNRIDFEIDKNTNIFLSADLDTDNNNNTVYFDNFKTLFNIEQLIAKYIYKQFDLSNNFWKIVLIDFVLKTKEKSNLLNNLFITFKHINEIANTETAL